MTFPCTSCGACCRRVGKVNPSMAKPDGSCLHLSKNNQCEIYETRPEYCRIVFKNDGRFKTETDYFKANIAVCKMFIDEDGMEKRFYPSLH